MQIELYVGENQGNPGLGANKLRGNRLGALVVAEECARYGESCMNGRLFNVASQAVATTTVGLATTYTGLCLSNPINSGKIALVNKAAIMQSVIQATQVEGYALAIGSNTTTNVTHTTPATIQANRVGSNDVSSMKADTAATLPTAPVYYMPMTNTALAAQNAPGEWIDLEGSLGLLPGGYILWVTPTQASVAGMWFSFQWEERPWLGSY